MPKKLISALCLTAVILISGCSDKNQSSTASVDTSAPVTESQPTETTPAESEPDAGAGYTLYGDFTKGSSTDFYASDGWSNGSMFNCTWRKRNCTFEDGVLKLSIDTDGVDGYSGGEYRTNSNYGYGMYEVSMKPIKNTGVVSSFFTYTGPSEDNPWDEIDIEFLGKDTTVVQFNYFTNGSGGHEFVYELGFDASEDFHTYAFEWKEDSITWYVDGEAVHTADKNIPVTPSKIMMNTWNGKGVDGWLGAYDGTTPITAEYEWVGFKAAE